MHRHEAKSFVINMAIWHQECQWSDYQWHAIGCPSRGNPQSVLWCLRYLWYSNHSSLCPPDILIAASFYLDFSVFLVAVPNFCWLLLYPFLLEDTFIDHFFIFFTFLLFIYIYSLDLHPWVFFRSPSGLCMSINALLSQRSHFLTYPDWLVNRELYHLVCWIMN